MTDAVSNPVGSHRGEGEAAHLPLITKPGAYPDIPEKLYHGGEICAAPSISSSGLKLINARSPRHYFWQSPLNPKRPERKQKRHFNLGSALHYILLIDDGRFNQHFHVLPEGFDARSTVKWAEHIEACNHAMKKGKLVLSKGQFDTLQAMAEAVSEDELASALITAGTPEITLAAIDPETGCWVRARPDNLPHNMEIIPDIKTTVDASLDVYERAATKHGYFMSAAHYLDVIDLVYGEAKRSFVLISVEKDPPYCVTIDQLDPIDIDMARLRNRAALNKFADCLKTGNWYGYNTPRQPIRTLQMTNFERAMINQAIDRGELSYA